jgi:hypothetical protein
LLAATLTAIPDAGAGTLVVVWVPVVVVVVVVEHDAPVVGL